MKNLGCLSVLKKDCSFRCIKKTKEFDFGMLETRRLFFPLMYTNARGMRQMSQQIILAPVCIIQVLRVLWRGNQRRLLCSSSLSTAYLQWYLLSNVTCHPNSSKAEGLRIKSLLTRKSLEGLNNYIAGTSITSKSHCKMLFLRNTEYIAQLNNPIKNVQWKK